MKRIPEAHGLEASGSGACNTQRHFICIRTAGGKQHLGEIAGRNCAKGFGQLYRNFIGETARRKGQAVDLALDRCRQARMGIADVVNAVAVEIHETAAIGILDPDAIGFRNRCDTGTRQALMQKGIRIALQQRA